MEAFLHASPSARIEQTFGMFADDAGFEAAMKLGREYRERANENVDE